MNVNIVTQEEFLMLNQKVERVLELLQVRRPLTESEWLKSSEVKNILKCSDTSLKNYRDNGIIPTTKIGGTFYYAKSDVEKLLDSKSKINPHETL